MEENNSIRRDFSHFGKVFQEKLAKLILVDQKFSRQIGEVLDYNFFELRSLRAFVKIIYNYQKEFKQSPSMEIMQSLLRTKLDEEDSHTQEEVRNYFARVLSSGEKVGDSDYVKSHALDFCRKQKLKEVMIKCVDLVNSSSFDAIRKLIEEAVSLGAENDFGHDYHDDFEDRYTYKARNPISTGWDIVDNLTRGGLGKGELGIVMASTGGGKSMNLVHLGGAAIKEGKTVVHFTLELLDTVVGLRYDSCLTGYGLNTLFDLKEEIRKDIKKFPGKLFIKQWIYEKKTTETIRVYLEKLQGQGIKPDIILVDYADLLKPVMFQKEKRHQLESIYEELRSIGQEYECPIWTASQTNRTGLNSEIIDMDATSESFNKCFVADFIYGVGRNMEDRENNTGTFYVAKNRNGRTGDRFPMFIDLRTVTLKVLDNTDSNGDQVVKESMKKNYQQAAKIWEEFKLKKQLKNMESGKDV